MPLASSTRLIFLLVLLISGAAAGEPNAKIDEASSRPSPLGINFHRIRPHSTELTFVDIFRTSRRWKAKSRSRSDTPPRDRNPSQAPALDLDEHGWVRSLAPNQRVESGLLTTLNGRLPSGTYTLLHEGSGSIDISGARLEVTGPGQYDVHLKGKTRSLSVRIRSTNPADPIRNIRVILPGFRSSYRQKPFHPDFLDRWDRFQVVRFMDWMETNDSKIERWSDRPLVEDWAQGTDAGVALEILIDLANTLGADPWFSIPHLADDEYVRNFAALVKKRLDPGLRAYIEYSNELWNGQFEQAQYARRRGRALGLAKDTDLAGLRFTARRSVEIFAIFEEVFGGTDRLVRVLPSQYSSPLKGREILSFEKAYEHADVYAVAPYFGGRLTGKNSDRLREGSVDALLAELGKEMEGHAEMMRNNAKLAEEFGLRLVAYEGGQHLRGPRGDDRFTQLLTDANRHPGMAALYAQHLANWKEAGGTLFVHFSSMGKYGDTGSWGALEWPDQGRAEAPKYRALLDFISRNPRWW